ncbi:unnamed protein product [Bubo scandiacus]
MPGDALVRDFLAISKKQKHVPGCTSRLCSRQMRLYDNPVSLFLSHTHTHTHTHPDRVIPNLLQNVFICQILYF